LVGAILSQSPAQGTVVPKTGTAVSVVVGEAGTETIPDVVGKTEAEARAAMAGIPNVTWGVAGGTPKGKAGTVQGQTAAGVVQIGTPVTVNVYGPEAPPTPTTAAASPPPSSGNRGPGGG
jgi:serine/threonine-protein kinase